MNQLIPVERIENKILLIREQKVMLDKDLAELYEVTKGNLNKATRRNIERFPEGFILKSARNLDIFFCFVANGFTPVRC